jgi:hypothetical protein
MADPPKTVHTTYPFGHRNPAIGLNYYRLKQVDFEGTFEYLEVVSVYFAGEAGQLSVYPNPSNGGVLTVALPETISDGGQVMVYDAVGKLLRSLNVVSATVQLKELASGLYLIEARGAGGAWREWVIVR